MYQLSEKDYKTIFESMSEGVLIADHGSMCFIACNQAVCKLLGYSQEELLQLSVLEIHPEEVLDFVKEDFSRYIKKEKKETKYIPFLRKDGKIIYCNIHATQLNLNGKEYTVGILTDVTEQKLAEEALQESEALFRSLFDNVDIGIAITSPKMEILLMNRQLKKWFPHIDDSKRPVCYTQYNNPPLDDICPWCPTIKTFQDGKLHESITSTPAESEIRHYRIISAPVRNHAGEVIAAIEMVEDVTNVRITEDKIQEQQLQLSHFSRLSMMCEIASGIAHELNQPLTAIVQYLGGSLEKLRREKMPTEIIDALMHAMIQAERAGNIVHNIKDLLATGEITKEKIDINLLIDETLELIGFSRNHRKINLELQLEKNLPLLYANKVQIQQVLVNLILNACEAMKGELIKEKKLLITTQFQKASSILISVQDTGIGVDETHKNKIFEPFVTTKKGNMGLGLSICRSIVESHGGQIHLNSLKNKTCFCIKFPTDHEKETSNELQTDCFYC